MLQFVHQISISIVQKTPSERRGFLFDVAAGFSKPVDLESGMTVNLVLVKEWLSELKSRLEAQIFSQEQMGELCPEVLRQARSFLTQRSVLADSELVSLSFSEHRGWGFSWSSVEESEREHLSYSHYAECFREGKFELAKVRFTFNFDPSSQRDFFHESARALDCLRPLDSKVLVQQLENQLSSLPGLIRIDLEYPGENYGLTLGS